MVNQSRVNLSGVSTAVAHIYSVSSLRIHLLSSVQKSSFLFNLSEIEKGLVYMVENHFISASALLRENSISLKANLLIFSLLLVLLAEVVFFVPGMFGLLTLP